MDNPSAIIEAEFLKSGWSQEAAQFLAKNWHTSLKGAQAVLDFVAKPLPTPSPKKARISNRDRKIIFERDGYRCQFCSGWKSLTVDHIIPESKGGSSEVSNLQTLCKSCNSKKGNRNVKPAT